MMIDRIEQKLIAELEADSRQSINKLAKKFQMSPPLLRYKLSSLKERNIIQGFYTVIDFYKLGYSLFRTMLRFSSITKEKYKSLISYLMQHSNVQYLVECGGRWDLIVNFMAKNIIQYKLYLKELQEIFPQEILHYNSLSVINVAYLARDYLIDSIRHSKLVFWFGSEFGSIKLDNIDLKILDLISENGKISFSDIGKKLKITPHTVIRRVSIMKKDRFIIGFSPLINLTNTQYSAYKAIVTLQYHTDQKRNEIINFLQSNVNVTNIIEFIGPWDFEIEFEVDSREKELELTRNFQRLFGTVIKEFEIIPLFCEYRHNFLPKDLVHEQP